MVANEVRTNYSYLQVKFFQHSTEAIYSSKIFKTLLATKSTNENLLFLQFHYFKTRELLFKVFSFFTCSLVPVIKGLIS